MESKWKKIRAASVALDREEVAAMGRSHPARRGKGLTLIPDDDFVDGNEDERFEQALKADRVRSARRSATERAGNGQRPDRPMVGLNGAVERGTPISALRAIPTEIEFPTPGPLVLPLGS